MKKKKKYEKPVLKIIEVELSCCIAASPFVTGVAILLIHLMVTTTQTK